jgi:tRNA pseudouridine13 synthase
MFPQPTRTGYLTDPLLRTGGTLKSVPEDFEVEELPAYQPGGEGEHLYLWIEKRDVSAEALQSHVSRRLGCSRGDIGMAGLKDRRAITRQWVSVPAKFEHNVPQIDAEGIRVLKSARHRNKLRTGHLRGNRFAIRVRGVDPGALETARLITRQIDERGVPNLYGDQRFGFDGETLKLGLELLSGRASADSIPSANRRFLLRFALSAAQSVLFNDVLGRRLESGLIHKLLIGDVMQVVTSGGLFVVEDLPTEQSRFDRRETVVTGPMFGPEMKPPTAAAADFEASALSAWNLSRSDFERYRRLTPGTRRPLLVWPENLEAEPDGEDLTLRFSLPPGAYATSVLREFQKHPA